MTALDEIAKAETEAVQIVTAAKTDSAAQIKAAELAVDERVRAEEERLQLQVTEAMRSAIVAAEAEAAELEAEALHRITLLEQAAATRKAEVVSDILVEF